MKQELEIIEYPKINHLKIFIDSVTLRSVHLHSDIEICFILDGEAVFKTEQKELKVKKNDILILNSNQPHSIESYTKMDGLFIQVSNSFLSKYFSNFSKLFFSDNIVSSFLTDSENAELIKEVVSVALLYFKEDKNYEFRTIGFICNLLYKILARVPNFIFTEKDSLLRQRNAERISRIISYIDDDNYSLITLTEAAKKENISPYHLSHIFKDNLGISFQDYISNRRFEQALRLMKDKTKTIIEISEESGFSDPKYMTMMFKEKFGLTPKNFRNNFSYDSSVYKKNSDSIILEYIYTYDESIKYIEEYIGNKITKKNFQTDY